MLSPDYVKASLIVVGPGKSIYSGGGHTALRLTCPSQQMDYYFSFEMALKPIEKLRYLSGSGRAGYAYTDFKTALNLYKAEGREMRGIQLNLSPCQKQELWRFLDTEYEKGPWRTFDYKDNNCSKMIVYAIGRSLGNEKIVWEYDSPELSGTYRSLLVNQFMHSPWNSLLLNLHLGEIGDDTFVGTSWLWPTFLLQEAQKAVIYDNKGNKRPLVVGEECILLKQTEENKPFLVTPKLLFVLLLVIAVVISLYQCYSKVVAVGYLIDVPFMCIHTLFGAFYTMTTISGISTGFNWIVLILNPLPFLLWIMFRKKPVMKVLYLLYTVILLGYMACTPWLPQLRTTPIAILFMAFAVRSFYHYYCLRKNT